MDLSIAQAAATLGKTERQIRYLIKTGRLKARRDGGRWLIASDDLPLSPAQRESMQKNVEAARQAVEQAIAPATAAADGKATERKHYSVTDLKAFRIGEGLLAQVEQAGGSADVVAGLLRQALLHLTRGCHTFHPPQKVQRLGEARDLVADAVTTLLLSGDEARRALALRIEQELIPCLGGLLASHERRYRRSRFERFDSSR